jgi:DNA-binding CsgD family transcriptional regulator
MRVSKTTVNEANSKKGLIQPQPGEIWQVSRCVCCPLEFTPEEERCLYSETAQNFLEGKSLARYVMIVQEAEPPLEPESEWQVVSVMVLSGETDFLSGIDLLIPKYISGLEQDLLAETWHVLPTLTCSLLQPIGQRISREVYEILLDVGDYYHGLIDELPAVAEIQKLGLAIASDRGENLQVIQEFHSQEEAWSDVLSVPLAAYQTSMQAVNLTDEFLDEALEIEAEVSNNMARAEAKKYGLTNRETEIWLLYRANYSYKEIATALYISLNTVKKHMKKIHTKRLAPMVCGASLTPQEGR